MSLASFRLLLQMRVVGAKGLRSDRAFSNGVRLSALSLDFLSTLWQTKNSALNTTDSRKPKAGGLFQNAVVKFFLAPVRSGLNEGEDNRMGFFLCG